MDERRFDDLTRDLGSMETRRRALRMLGSGGLAVLLARLSVGESEAACRKAKKPCNRDKQCCSGRCKKGRCKGNGAPAGNFCEGKEQAIPCGDGCFCQLTLSEARFCGTIDASTDCVEDAQCAGLTGPGSLCVFNKDGDGQCAVACLNPD